MDPFDTDDTWTCEYCGYVMINSGGFPICPSCGGDPDLDDDDDEYDQA